MASEPELDLPQVGPARLIVRVLESSAEGARCLARVPTRSPFRRDSSGRSVVPAFLCLEMAAQASAAAEAATLRARPSADSAAGPAPHGWVVGTRDLDLGRSDLPADADFWVTTTSAGQAPPLRTSRFEIHVEGELVADGTLSTFRAD